MSVIFGIRREDLDKLGEKRVAISPHSAKVMMDAGHQILVQPAVNPVSGENKRAFPDEMYAATGAKIAENLRDAQIIIGLKEVAKDDLIPEKTYFFFSHTHKGQLKNRALLQAMVEKRISLIDYELIADERDRRLLTAFTYFAGYAGMTDTLWALGQRWRHQGIASPFEKIPQSVEREDLELLRQDIRFAGEEIRRMGTPADLPPVITAILGNGKTSAGSQRMYSELPVEHISMVQLQETFLHGSRKKVYQLLLEISDMFRIRSDSPYAGIIHDSASFQQLYLSEPQHFESNLEQIFPYATILMNCILWGPSYPRLLTKENTAAWWQAHQVLQVIGDISCDPEGAIQFSKETWIDNPVYVYDPSRQSFHDGFEGPGIAVMAVTNLPCEIPADASAQFSAELEPWILALASADLQARTVDQSGLPDPLQRATILWKGELTPAYAYMKDFLQVTNPEIST